MVLKLFLNFLDLVYSFNILTVKFLGKAIYFLFTIFIYFFKFVKLFNEFLITFFNFRNIGLSQLLISIHLVFQGPYTILLKVINLLLNLW